jgi:hypothetical protein
MEKEKEVEKALSSIVVLKGNTESMLLSQASVDVRFERYTNNTVQLREISTPPGMETN